MTSIQKALEIFQDHYRKRFGAKNAGQDIEYSVQEQDGISAFHYIHHSKLRPGNGPRILSHDKVTDDVIVLTHGLSDSPFYMEAIARHFYREGCNVVMPLLPAHGLIDPDAAMEDRRLDSKWKEAIDNAVETAQHLGQRISIGGFSTGGALSLNKVLRDGKQIKGGLFLFSAALEISDLTEDVGRLGFIQTITRITDGKVRGIGPDPYKYPELPSFAGLELIQIINENNDMLEKQQVYHPVFIAHSAHDSTAKLEGVFEFLERDVEYGVATILAQGVEHSCLVLEQDVELGPIENPDDEPGYPPIKNPQFAWMMDSAMRFFRGAIAS